MKREKGFISAGTILLMFVLFGIIGFGAYSLGKGNFSLEGIFPKTTPTSDVNTETPTPNSDNDIEAIKKAVYEKTGISEEKAQIIVSTREGDFVKGGISFGQDVGGAYFIAAKKNGIWVVVYDGQSTPTCKQLISYVFPASMVPECQGADGNIVKR
jgi:hypothetical protein